MWGLVQGLFDPNQNFVWVSEYILCLASLMLFFFFQERISVVTSSSCPSVEKLNMSDTEALYPATSDSEAGASCFPDRPIPKNIFKAKNCGHSRQTSSNWSKTKNVPYKPVERKVPWNWVCIWIFILDQCVMAVKEYLGRYFLCNNYGYREESVESVHRDWTVF